MAGCALGGLTAARSLVLVRAFFPGISRGNKKLGPQLIEASWVSIYRDRGLGCAYVGYKKRMEPQEAIVRVARKLSNIIFSVLKNGREYEPYEWNER